jgi:hypothetical protein
MGWDCIRSDATIEVKARMKKAEKKVAAHF